MITNKNKEMNKLTKPLAGLQPQIIQNWAIDKKKIIQGHYDRRISTFFESEDKNEQFQKLHQILVKWAILCGVKPLPLDEEIKLLVNETGEITGVKGKDLYAPLRISLFGEVHGPDIPLLIGILGIDETIIRIQRHI